MNARYDFRIARLYDVEIVIPRRMYVVDKFIAITNEYQELVLTRTTNDI